MQGLLDIHFYFQDQVHNFQCLKFCKEPCLLSQRINNYLFDEHQLLSIEQPLQIMV